MDDLLSEFLTETNESLAELDVDLVRLEQSPNDPELLGHIFRLVHTIKGTCGFLGLPRLEAVAHSGENVLGKFRDGAMEVSSDAVSLILEALDRIKDILGVLEATEHEPEGDDNDLIERLNQLAKGDLTASADAAEAAPAEAAAPDSAVAAVAPTAAGGNLFDELGGAIAIECAVDIMIDKAKAESDLAALFAKVELDSFAGGFKAMLTMLFGGPELDQDNLAQQLAVMAGNGFDEASLQRLCALLREAFGVLGATPEQSAAAVTMIEGAHDTLLVAAPEAEEAPAPAAAAEAKPAAKPAKEKAPAEEAATAQAKESQVAAQSIRVNVDLLENLMTMVSELVLSRNQLMQILRGHQESEFAAPLQRLSHVTTELQEGVMKTRMQPIGNAWAKLPRIIRDLSLELGKKIELRMLGADTELDRQVLELIRDPLTHMVRNSGDHGLEGPKERVAAGKKETGTVTLNAYHEGGHIIIEVSDDGRGLNVEKIKQKIVANGLASEADLESMPDQQIYQFIFKAGFSTAETVTNVSGRGVGMDVVRTNIERIGGTVELSSRPGRGSTFTIKIPLTLAIVSALIVESGGERFAIPQISVVELVRASSHSEHTIERIRETPVLRLRNRLLPLVSLRELLRLQRTAPVGGNGAGTSDGNAPDVESDEQSGRTAGEENFIVVSQVGNTIFGIIVDRVFDTEEIVVKPVAPILRNIHLFSGNTILGDGSVIMILDPNGIAGAIGDAALAEAEDTQAAQAKDTYEEQRVAMLLFRAGEGAPKAVPLALVARLEEIEFDKIETSNGQPTIQYRGHLMPLVMLDPSLPMAENGRQPVLVFADGDRSMGLMVSEIVDIVEERLDVELTADIPGLMGSAVLSGKATDVIDASHYLERAYHDWFSASEERRQSQGRRKRVLLVDDSPFFRNLLSPVLSVAGFSVTSVDSGSAAMELCERGEDFDVIVSDIEMPGMSGFDLAAAVRGNSRWADVPLVALSSHTSAEDLERGRAVGFSDYVAKSDREALLHTLSQTLSDIGGAA